MDKRYISLLQIVPINVTDPQALQRICNQVLPTYQSVVMKVSSGISNALGGIITPDGVFFLTTALAIGILLMFKNAITAILKFLLAVNLILFFVFGVLPAIT